MAEEKTECSELLPYSKISRVIKRVTDKRFAKTSVQLIQYYATELIREIAELSEKQSRIRSGKLDKKQAIIIQKEDVIAAIQKGGRRFSFINFSTEFLDDCLWHTDSS